jgi:hypothetical protein
MFHSFPHFLPRARDDIVGKSFKHSIPMFLRSCAEGVDKLHDGRQMVLERVLAEIV